MSRQPDNNHYVRRVVLPSGKMIEVVYFEDPIGTPEVEAQRTQSSSSVADLHVCASCESELVYPTEWDEASTSHWEVALRCPNCEWTGTGIFEQEIVERFDEELDRGTEALVRDLKRLMHANMEDEIERFVSALTLDQILPEDF
jgi:phage-related protein